MISFTLNTKSFEDTIREYRQGFFAASQRAVLNTSRMLMTSIISKTPKPPTPAGQVYQRTGRLVAGWGPAANFLGLGASSGEGRFEWSVSEDMIRFAAINDVPYAYYVEVIGPWDLPPNARGGPRWRGGEYMVARSIAELSTPGGNALIDQLEQEINRL